MSGPFAAVGTDGSRGAQIAAKLINASGGILGKQVEIVIRDEQLQATATVNALRDLNSSGVPLTFGYTSTADCQAAVGVAKQINSVVMGAGCATTSLTTSGYDPHFVRVTANDAMANEALATFVKEKFPSVARWNTFAFDYVTGHDQWNGFVADLKAKSIPVTIGKEVFFPLTATDLNSYLTSMASSLPANSAQTDGLYLGTFGNGTNALIKQGQPLNIFSKFKVVVNLNAGGFLAFAKQLGAATPEIQSEYDYYYKAFNTPLNQQFVSEYQKAYNEPPGTWAAESFDAVYAYKAAIEKAGNANAADVIKAFDNGITFTGYPGQVTIRGADHQADVPVVIRHVKGGDVVDFVVIPGSQILPPVQK